MSHLVAVTSQVPASSSTASQVGLRATGAAREAQQTMIALEGVLSHEQPPGDPAVIAAVSAVFQQEMQLQQIITSYPPNLGVNVDATS